ncbi:hydrogenase maturation nickel metallochaperone HypA [Thermodesulfatator atlanticus]
MHETSLVLAMCSQIEEMARAQKAQEVLSITVRIGEVAGVEEEIFAFAFEVYKKENPLFKKSELKIEKIPARKKCLACGEEFQGLSLKKCPRCGKEQFSYTGGDELQIAKVELMVED